MPDGKDAATAPVRLIRPLLRAQTGSDLDALLRSEAQAGNLTFARFMALALYHPEHGYYMVGNPQGPRGDYLTSPHVHPAFGWAAAAQIEELWQACAQPQRFDVVEWGAGDGLLCEQALTWAAGTDFGDALRWTLVDASPAARSRQAGACAAWLKAGAARLATPGAVPRAEGPGCLLSNELFDSLPVELVTMRAGSLLQAYVVWQEAGLALDWRPAAAPLSARLAEGGTELAEGQLAEVCLELDGALGELSAALDRGYLLAFDYGYPAQTLYASWRKAGTLMTFYRQTAGADPLLRPGRQDITAHVDFSALARAGERLGWRVAGFSSQAAFLLSLGAGQAARELLDLRPDAAEVAADLRRGVDLLTDAAGLGRIRALLLVKDAPTGAFSGFQDDDSASLHPSH
jgi:SAM-dependent MidA family methyltransferase